MQKDLEFLTFIFTLSNDDLFIWEIQNSISLSFQLSEIEAIHISLFVDVSDVLVIVFIQNVSTLKLKFIFMFLCYFAISFVCVRDRSRASHRSVI